MVNIRPRVSPEGRYSMNETADLLGVDRVTIWRWRKMGYLKETKPRRVNRKKYILGREILKVYDAYC